MIKRIFDLELFMLLVINLTSGAMLFQSFFYPSIPASFPRLVSAITFVLTCYLLVGRWVGKIGPSRIKGGGGQGPRWWLFSLGLFCYFLLVQLVGFLAGTFLLILLVPLWVSGTTRRWGTALVYAAIVTVVFGLAMKWVMQTSIPSGILFK